MIDKNEKRKKDNNERNERKIERNSNKKLIK
jgi:hypothetical protein